MHDRFGDERIVSTIHTSLPGNGLYFFASIHLPSSRLHAGISDFFALGSLKSEINQRLGLAGDNICNLKTKSK